MFKYVLALVGMSVSLSVNAVLLPVTEFVVTSSGFYQYDLTGTPIINPSTGNNHTVINHREDLDMLAG